MAMLRLNRFGGIAPIMDPQKLPEPFAIVAQDCLFEGGNLKAVPGKETLAISYGFQTYNTRSLFRLTDVQWLKWVGDVAAVKGPTPIVSNYLTLGDDYRIYFAGCWDDQAPTVVQWPQFTSRYRATGNIDPSSYFDRPALTYPLGVPAPQSVPTVAASAAPTGTVTTLRKGNPVTVVTLAAHNRTTGQRLRLSGLPSSGDGSELEGAQYAITVVDDTNFKLDSVDGSEWTADRTGLTATWTRVYADSEVEDRIYVYTYINEFGEEGMPSSPSSIVSVGEGQTVEVGMDINPAVTPPNAPEFNLSAKRIYRSVSGSDSAQFKFVAEVLIGVPTYTDNVSLENLGEVLTTETYALPPAKLQGIVLHPNGFLIGFYDNVLCMSEPYLPYAWPVAYRKTLGVRIVGLELFGQSVVVVTEAEPQIGGATDPASLTLEMMRQVFPGTSRQGICSTGRSVVWVSPVGLIVADGNGARDVTRQYFSQIQWQSQYALTTDVATYPTTLAFQDNRVWMSVQGQQLYSFDMHDDGRIDVVNHNTAPSTLFVDRQADALFMMDYSATEAARRLYRFNKDGASRTYTWTSRRFHMPAEINMGVLQLFAVSYGAGISVTVFANEGSHSQSLTVTSQAPMRLESGFLSRDWRVSVTGTAEIQAIHVAESVEELRSVAL